MAEFLYRQLAKTSRFAEVRPGQEIEFYPDLVLAHDGTGPQILAEWKRNGIKNSCKRVVFTLDHAFPAPTVDDRSFHKEFELFSNEQGCCLYNHGEGVLHQVVAEEEQLELGMVIVGADGHVATAGAFGAIAFSVSPKELVSVLNDGVFRTTVPEQVTIAIEGLLPRNVLPRDIAMYIVKEHLDQIKGKAVALTGSLFNEMSLSGKMTVCNFLPEGGALTAFALPPGEEDTVDINIDARKIQQLIAVPESPTAIKTVKEVPSVRINAAIAGGCSAGRLEDMKIIADVLKDNKVHPGVTFIITPASRTVLESMEMLNITRVLRGAGAVIMPPGCGPCPGKHFGLLAEGDTAVTTTIRNTPGRIGSKEARIYLASPLTVALSAVKGKITSPH